MDVELKTNRTNSEPEHRLVLKAKEIVDFVYPRFKFINGSFKIVKWRGKDGLQLHFKKLGKNSTGENVVVVGFEEPGYGTTETYYSLNWLRSRVEGTETDR